MEGSFDEEREMTITQPLLNNSPKGGFRTLPFITANAMLEFVATFGLLPNMPMYLMDEYHMDMTTSSNIQFYWLAALNFTPVVGAFMADSYVGRFNSIGFGSVLAFLGMAILWLTTSIPGARPPPCDELTNHCSLPTIPQLLMLCTSFLVTAIGIGGIRSGSCAFSIDQLANVDAHKVGKYTQKIVGWYVAAYNLSALIGYIGLVYVQVKMGWEFGFGVNMVVMLFSSLSFFLGIPLYLKVKTKGNLILELTQVIVASCKKRHLEFSSKNANIIFHHKKGSSMIFPTEKLRFLNKACIIQNAERELTPEGSPKDSWSLCTVDQVEDLKVLLKVIPIWSTGMVMFACLSQSSFQILQATSMNRKITENLQFPAGSFISLSTVSMILWAIFYDQVLIPLVSRIRGKPTHFSTKQRMGAAIFLSCVCLIITALVECIRRNLANDPDRTLLHMSATWLVPQYCLMGIAQVISSIAQGEFYFSEFPRHMSSIATTLCYVGISVGNLLASFLLNTIDDLSKRGGRESWVSTNINRGHYDYYFWFLSGLCMVDFIFFFLCCWNYGPFKGEKEDNPRRDEQDVLG